MPKWFLCAYHLRILPCIHTPSTPLPCHPHPFLHPIRNPFLPSTPLLHPIHTASPRSSSPTYHQRPLPAISASRQRPASPGLHNCALVYSVWLFGPAGVRAELPGLSRLCSATPSLPGGEGEGNILLPGKVKTSWNYYLWRLSFLFFRRQEKGGSV